MNEKKRILLVDDEPMMLQTLKRLLMDFRKEWDIQTTENPFTARDMLKSEPFDAAVIDVMMPGINGLELLEELQKDSFAQKVQYIILTGLGDKDLKRKALDIGATDLLNKPVGREDLIARLKNALRMKEYADELRQTNADLEHELVVSQKVKLVGILSAGVVHDLKNIMTIIGGYNYLVTTMVGDNEEVKRPLQKIKEAIKNATDVMMQILNFSKPEQAVKKPVELVKLIDFNMPLFKPLLSKGVDVTWIPPEDKIWISGIEAQITQVLMNLVINAGQAMDHRGKLLVELARKTYPATEDSDPADVEYALIRITDTGPGMDAETIQKIFQPHFTTKSSKGGSGLGLMVVQWIVENNKGQIKVESVPGEGATFELGFPTCSEPESNEKHD